MKLQYELLPSDSQLNGDLHVRDITSADRHETKRRLDFITAKLANKALRDIELSVDINAYDLVCLHEFTL